MKILIHILTLLVLFTGRGYAQDVKLVLSNVKLSQAGTEVEFDLYAWSDNTSLYLNGYDISVEFNSNVFNQPDITKISETLSGSNVSYNRLVTQNAPSLNIGITLTDTNQVRAYWQNQITASILQDSIVRINMPAISGVAESEKETSVPFFDQTKYLRRLGRFSISNFTGSTALGANLELRPLGSANFNNAVTNFDNNGDLITIPNTAGSLSLINVPDIFWNGEEWQNGSGVSFEPGSADASKGLYIAAAGAELNSQAEVADFEMASGTDINIQPGASLNVNGTVTQNGQTAADFVLNADGTGYAQYLGPAISGTYEQYIDGSAGWRYISSPVDGNTINDLNFSQPFTVVTDGSNAQNVWAYNANTGQWEPGGTANISQRGVNVYFQNSELPMTISTTGTLNSGNGTRTVSTSYNDPQFPTNGGGTGWADAVTEGWNLVANPYPTTLNVADMSFPADMDDAIYIWDANAGNFAAYVGGVGTNNGTQYIAPMNAFYVRVNSVGTPTLDLSSAGVIASPSFLKAPTANNGMYMTVINPFDKRDEVFVGFNFDATEGFDKAHDAYKMPSTNINVPNLATGEDVLSINNLPEIFGGDQYTIPVIFESAHDGVHKFSWDLTNLDYDVEVYLEDKVEGIMYPLDGNDYQFNYSTTDRKDRFVLHFNRGVVSDEPFDEESNFNMWMGWENTVNVEFGQDGFADISITNVMGQVIISDSHIDMSETYQIQIPNATSAAIYVVTITTSNGNQYTQKLLAR